MSMLIGWKICETSPPKLPSSGEWPEWRLAILVITGFAGMACPSDASMWVLATGYRVYYAMAGKQLVLLLCGGDKRTQNADIDRACSYWKHWQKEKSNE